METLKLILIVVGAYTLSGFALSVYAYFKGDRSGNSGRFRHWSDEGDDDAPSV